MHDLLHNMCNNKELIDKRPALAKKDQGQRNKYICVAQGQLVMIGHFIGVVNLLDKSNYSTVCALFQCGAMLHNEYTLTS